MDVRKKAQELAHALVNSDEYKRFTEARDAVAQHQAAQVMLKDFQKKQMALQKQQMEGSPITESQTEELRKLYEVISVNPYIRELFEAEFVFGGLMMEIQDTISKSLGFNEEEESEEEDQPQVDAPSKKLWTPGN